MSPDAPPVAAPVTTAWVLGAAPVDVLVGTDIQPVADIEAAVRAHGDRYLDRVFTAHEVAASGGRDRLPSALAESLAARFAAKEATIKVLRPEPGDAPRWTEVEVISHPGGWAEIGLVGHAAYIAERAGISCLRLSMAHGGGQAVATVIGVRRGASPAR